MNKTTTKILFLIQIPPPVHGSSLIGQRIKDSKLINENFEADFVNTMTSRNMKELGKKPLLKFSRFLGVSFQFFKLLLTKKYDLCLFAITSKGKALYRDLLFIGMLKLFGTKYVLLMNNKGVSSVSHKWIHDKIYKFLFKNAHVIINSIHIYPDIEKYVKEENLSILFNGIPDVIKQESSRKENEVPQLLYLGNMTRSKGAFVLLEACKILHQKQLNFKCNFVGAWNDITEEEFNDFIHKNNLKQKVEYLGPKYDDDKWTVYQQSDIFVFPTYYHYECFPLVLLEAMQHALPVISTPEGGIRDIVDNEKTGYLVEQENEKELAEKLSILVENDKLRKQMGNEGRSKYEKVFTLNAFERRLKEILETVK